MPSGFVGEIDGYTPAPARSSVPTRLSAHDAAPSAPLPTYNGDETVLLTYDINHINQEPMDIAPPAYESIFGAANAVITRTTAMVIGKGIPAQNTSYREVPEADDHGGDTTVTKHSKTIKIEINTDTPDTCCDVIWKFLCVNILICGIPIAQLVLGIVYMDECPINGGQIQLYLILNGAVFILAGMRLWLPNQMAKCWLGIVMNVIAIIGCLFLIAWFIVGSVWVFKIYKSVEYKKRDLWAKDRLEVTPDKEIDAPFQSNKFNIATKYGTNTEELKIYWNGNRWNDLYINQYIINVCDTSFDDYKNGTGTEIGGVWAFLVKDDCITIWFDDEMVLNVTKYDGDVSYCYFWDYEIKSVKLSEAAFSIQFDDEELNKKTFGKEVYCNKTMYLFAFWLLVLIYVTIGAVSVIGFCMSGLHN